jgi:two-component system NtrC family response regulator
MASILIVDDDAALRDALAEAVRDLGHRAVPAADGAAALAALDRTAVAAVLLDLRMPGMDGLDVLRRIRARPTPPAVTVLTAHATAGNTIEAMRLGAFDHLTKPIGRDMLARTIAGMLASGDDAQRPAAAMVEEELIGSSEAMRAIQKTIGMVADGETTVLVTGETGTGKELVARAIHEHGGRRARPFVPVNCAAIPADLLESELFGHLRGAFTGAVADRAGAFRQAEGGTLFLDEIGDMAIGMQAKILRALQERVVTPVGGQPIPVDVRVIAATHRDLARHVRDGGFREDLYYRLHVVPIHLPPLRDRIADIVPLAEHFLRGFGAKRLSADAAAELVRHAWPGNVRELRNAMDRAAALARGGTLAASDLRFLDAEPAGAADAIEWPRETLPRALARLEEMLVRRALRHSGGNRAEAARELGIHRQLLYAKLKLYGLDLSEDATQGVAKSDADRTLSSK